MEELLGIAIAGAKIWLVLEIIGAIFGGILTIVVLIFIIKTWFEL